MTRRRKQNGMSASVFGATLSTAGRDTLNDAFALVVDRIRVSDAYRAARAEVLDAAVATCAQHVAPTGRLTVAITDVVTAVIGALPPATRANVGSQLVPLSVADVLRLDTPALRAETQRRLATITTESKAV